MPKISPLFERTISQEFEDACIDRSNPCFYNADHILMLFELPLIHWTLQAGHEASLATPANRPSQSMER